jgi:hypothetical protein
MIPDPPIFGGSFLFAKAPTLCDCKALWRTFSADCFLLADRLFCEEKLVGFLSKNREKP